jgi:acetyl-CoA carboxylase carboxyl transferase subunit alpha
MLENSVYSVISPEGCASILWKDASKADEAAQCLRLTARDAKGLGVVEAILTEKDLGQRSFYTRLQGRLEREVTALLANENLLEERYQRFRSFGRWQENQKEG